MTQPIHPMLANVATAIDAVLYSRLCILPDAETTQEAARAAIQALLEPDEGMVEAGASAPFNMDQDVGHSAAERVFRAMLLPLVEGEAE